jgi:hypothetical protein
LLEAADGSLAERHRLTSLAPNVPVVEDFTSAELGGALGRDAVVHVALAIGALTERLLADTRRYRGFRRRET